MKKIKNVIKLLSIVIGVGMFASCSSSYNMRQANTRVELQKEDFNISDQVIGEVKQIKVLGVDWKRLFNKSRAKITTPLVSSKLKIGKVEKYALFDLLDKNKGHDVVFYPSFEREDSGFLFFYHKTTAKASARLGKLK